MVHGGGGEFFRDHYVIQDFPFYGSSRSNLERYHDLRMSPITFPSQALSPTGRDLFATLRPAMLARFRELLAPTNNETYDRLFLFIRAPEFFGQYFSNYINMGLDVVAPLLDYCNVHAAMALSPWRRFFFAWHRKMITAHCPQLATTADCGRVHVLKRIPLHA